MHKRGEQEEKSLTLQIFLKWYLREPQVRSTKPSLPSSLLFDKKTLSQAEQKINEPISSDWTLSLSAGASYLCKVLIRGETAPSCIRTGTKKSLSSLWASCVLEALPQDFEAPPGSRYFWDLHSTQEETRVQEVRRHVQIMWLEEERLAWSSHTSEDAGLHGKTTQAPPRSICLDKQQPVMT